MIGRSLCSTSLRVSIRRCLSDMSLSDGDSEAYVSIGRLRVCQDHLNPQLYILWCYHMFLLMHTRSLQSRLDAPSFS